MSCESLDGTGIIGDICYSVTLPDGRIVTNPSEFDPPETPGDVEGSPYSHIVYNVKLPGGHIVTNPSQFPSNQAVAK